MPASNYLQHWTYVDTFIHNPPYLCHGQETGSSIWFLRYSIWSLIFIVVVNQDLIYSANSWKGTNRIYGKQSKYSFLKFCLPVSGAVMLVDLDKQSYLCVLILNPSTVMELLKLKTRDVLTWYLFDPLVFSSHCALQLSRLFLKLQIIRGVPR